MFYFENYFIFSIKRFKKIIININILLYKVKWYQNIITLKEIIHELPCLLLLLSFREEAK